MEAEDGATQTTAVDAERKKDDSEQDVCVSAKNKSVPIKNYIEMNKETLSQECGDSDIEMYLKATEKFEDLSWDAKKQYFKFTEPPKAPEKISMLGNSGFSFGPSSSSASCRDKSKDGLQLCPPRSNFGFSDMSSFKKQASPTKAWKNTGLTPAGGFASSFLRHDMSAAGGAWSMRGRRKGPKMAPPSSGQLMNHRSERTNFAGRRPQSDSLLGGYEHEESAQRGGVHSNREDDKNNGESNFSTFCSPKLGRPPPRNANDYSPPFFTASNDPPQESSFSYFDTPSRRRYNWEACFSPIQGENSQYNRMRHYDDRCFDSPYESWPRMSEMDDLQSAPKVTSRTFSSESCGYTHNSVPKGYFICPMSCISYIRRFIPEFRTYPLEGGGLFPTNFGSYAPGRQMFPRQHFFPSYQPHTSYSYMPYHGSFGNYAYPYWMFYQQRQPQFYPVPLTHPRYFCSTGFSNNSYSPCY